jgi:hypothetical protein
MATYGYGTHPLSSHWGTRSLWHDHSLLHCQSRNSYLDNQHPKNQRDMACRIVALSILLYKRNGRQLDHNVWMHNNCSSRRSSYRKYHLGKLYKQQVISVLDLFKDTQHEDLTLWACLSVPPSTATASSCDMIAGSSVQAAARLAT